jgi:hypothetical protein
MTPRVAILLGLLIISNHGAAGHPAKDESLDLAIDAVNVDLTMRVHVFDAETKRPIVGATVTLVRSEDAQLVSPDDPPDPVGPQQTGSSGVAKLQARFYGNRARKAWVIMYSGHSYLLVAAPGYSSSRAWVSRPIGHPLIRNLSSGKVAVEQIDATHFSSDATVRKVSYRVALRRPNA